MRKSTLLSLLLPGLLMAETAIEIPNADFEKASSKLPANIAVLPEAAHSGKLGLRLTDDSTTNGPSYYIATVPVTPGKHYAIRFWGKRVSQDGAASIYMKFFNKDKKEVNYSEKDREHSMHIKSPTWLQHTLVGTAPQDAVSMRIWLHAIVSTTGTFDVDDVSLAELDEEDLKTVKSNPIENTQKSRIKPLDPARVAEIAAMLPEQPTGNGPTGYQRDLWEKYTNTEQSRKLIETAEKELTKPPVVLDEEVYLQFSRNGNRTNYQRLLTRRSARINAFAKAELIEWKGRFIPALENELTRLFSEKSWTLPAHDGSLTCFNQKQFHGDLAATAMASTLAHIDWWLRDKLSPAIRKQLREQAYKRVLTPFMEDIRAGAPRSGHWWIIGGNNWNAVCYSNVIHAALILAESRQERAEFIAAAENGMPFFFAGYPHDGYCTEGVGYWGYGFGHFTTLAETVLNATGGKIDFYQCAPHVRACCAYPANIQMEEGLCPAFADCGIRAVPSRDAQALIQRHIPDVLIKRIPPMDSIGDYTLTALRLFTDESKYGTDLPEKATFPPRSLFTDAGIYIGRCMDDDKGNFTLAFKAGHNGEQHNHNDVGSFVVALNKTPYFLDPGSEVYTRRTFSKQRYVSQMLNSYGHMVPVVAGKLQSTGRQSRGTFVKTDFTDAADTLVCDMREAYKDVPELKSLLRTVTFDRVNRKLVVRDEVEFTTPQTFSTGLVTYKSIHQLSGNSFTAYDGNSGLQAVIDVEGAELATQVGEIINENATNPKRIDVALTTPVTKGAITITISEFKDLAELPGFYRAPADLKARKPLVKQAITIEAEKFSAQEGGEVAVEDKPGAQGQAFKLWDKLGHKLSWEVEIPKDGVYAIQLRLAIGFNNDDSKRAVAIDGKLVHPENEPLLLPHTTGWASTNAADWKEAWLAHKSKLVTVKLSSGKHTLTMENVDGRGVNLDWIKFVPLP